MPGDDSLFLCWRVLRNFSNVGVELLIWKSCCLRDSPVGGWKLSLLVWMVRAFHMMTLMCDGISGCAFMNSSWDVAMDSVDSKLMRKFGRVSGAAKCC